MMEAQAIYDIFREKKVCVLVPTYNNAKTICEVLKGVLSYTDQVIVVNDGSTDNTLDALSRFAQVKIVSYSDNRGKGYALRKGMALARESGYHYAITIDSDGQHFPSDLPKFVHAVDINPSSIVIGVRNMNQASVPGKSSFGNKFSNFWFQVETGLKLQDTQSGFRLYPLREIEKMKFFTRKFEFEIEILVRSAWKGIAIAEVPVQVVYAEGRVSHFRPFHDFTRISILNTILVIIAFFYIKPRNFFRSIKKKTSGRQYELNSTIPMKQFSLEQHR